ncbi:MAG: pilin [Clostridia bacterium]|nr:pilin [Clostridia bacterium]
MKRNLIKGIAILLLMIMLYFSISANMIGYCTEEYEGISSSYITNGAKDRTGVARSAKEIIQSVLTIAQVIGVGVAVIMLIVLAIKYISAAPSDKAEIKKHMVVYVVGSILLFAASGFLEIIKRFASMVKPSEA